MKSKQHPDLHTLSYMHPFANLRKRALSGAVFCAMAGLVPSLFSATSTWVGNTDTDWVTAANWTLARPVSGDSLIFGAAGTAGSSLTNTLTSAGFNIGAITFSASAPAYILSGNTFTIGNGNVVTNNSANLQTFNNTGGVIYNSTSPTIAATNGNIAITNTLSLARTTAPTLTVNGASRNVTVGALDLASTIGTTARTNLFNGTGHLIVSGTTQASQAAASGISYTGSGSLSLGGAGTFTGSTTFSSGTLKLAHTQALQHSTLSTTGAAVVFESSVASHAFTLGGLTGSGNITLSDNAGSPNAVALSVGNNNTSPAAYSGNLSGSGSLNKVGSGNITLTNSNAYNGSTIVTAGTLALSGSGAINNSSLLDLKAGGILDTTAKTGGFTMLGGQQIKFTLDATATGSAGLLNAGTLDITSGVVDFATIGSLDDAAYIIANYSSLSGAAFGTVTNLPGGYTIDYGFNSGTQIALTAVPEPQSLVLLALGLMVIVFRGGLRPVRR